MDNPQATQPTAADIAKQLAVAADNAPSFGGLKPAAQAVAGFAAAICAEVRALKDAQIELEAHNQWTLSELKSLNDRLESSISNEGDLLAKLAELEAKLSA